MKIGIFGGTFNPPHIGHLLSARTAAEQLGLEKLFVIPSGMPPHKTIAEDAPSAKMRFLLTETSFKNEPGVVVSNIEIKNPEASYTVDTVKTLAAQNPDSRIFLLVGADMYLTLDMWKDCEQLLELATPAVFFRSHHDKEKIVSFSLDLKKRYGVDTVIIDNNIVDISSSRLRELLPMRGGSGYITDTTYSYIIRYRLYNAKPDWIWLRDRAYSMLDPARIPHVAGCEGEAVRLAARWGVDPDDAREAAILHDITKKLTPEEHIEILERHGMNVGILGNAEEKLLHAKSGAALAKSMFGVSGEVAGAILWHTTGRAGMTPLEKVIYLADYIEPERDIPGIAALRAAAFENIDAALIMGMEMSVEDMVSRDITPDRTTFDAIDDLKNRE